MAIAERLKEARVKAGLSQEQVSDRLHVSRQLVSKWESGASEPKASELVQCAVIYGTTLDWLCDRTPSAPEADTPTQPEDRQPENLQPQEAVPPPEAVQPKGEARPPEEVSSQEGEQPQGESRPAEEVPPQPEKSGIRKRLSPRKAVQALLLLLAGALVAVIILLPQLLASNQRLQEYGDHLSINDPFYDYSLPVWKPNNVPLVTVDPEAIQTPVADKEMDTYETRRFEIIIEPGKMYQITDFLELPAGSMVTVQAEYIPSASFVSYGLMDRDWKAIEALTHNEIHGRVYVPEAGEYCLYIQNGSEQSISVQGYYTYLAVDAHTPVIQR